MTALQPEPGKINFGGVDRKLFFDYAAIEKLQDIYHAHPYTVLKSFFAEDPTEGGYYNARPLIDTFHILLNNEVSREKCLEGHSDLKELDRTTVAHMITRDNANAIVMAIISAWTGQTPPADEDDDEDDGPPEEPEGDP